MTGEEIADPGTGWFVSREPGAHPGARVFCFPHAGGNPRTFLGWQPGLGADAEILAVCRPGREHRAHEPAPTFEEYVEGAAEAIRAVSERDGRPAYLFGHSLGALVAFELGRRLASRHRVVPRHLIVSALRAPHLPRTNIPEHTLPEPEFRARLREFDGTPEEVLADEALMEVVGPILRADLAIPATYEHPPGARVTWPITAFAGMEDTEAPPDDVGAWREETTGAFALHVLPDGHFFVHSQESSLLRTMSGLLRTAGGPS